MTALVGPGDLAGLIDLAVRLWRGWRADGFPAYMAVNALVAVNALALPMVLALLRHTGAGPATRLAVTRLLLLAALLAVPLAALLPRLPGSVLIEFGGGWNRLADFVTDAEPGGRSPAADGPVLSSDLGGADGTPRRSSAVLAVTLLTGLAAAWRLAWLGIALARLRAVIAASTSWRRVGRLDVRITTRHGVPFAFRSGGVARIMLPSALAADPVGWGLALRHEGQHHRQGDLLWLGLLEILGVLLPLNPGLWWWRRVHRELQEFACDAGVVGRHPGLKRAYGRCLIDVTAAALGHRGLPAGTAGMALVTGAGSDQQPLLARRLSMLARHHGESATRGRLWRALAVTAWIPMIGAAWVAQAARAPLPLTVETVSRVLAEAPAAASGQSIPLVVNQRVVDRLNRLLGDQGRRDGVKAALERMAEYRPAIERELDRYGHPRDILAVPLVESGYRNLPQRVERTVEGGPMGAGLWMFIRQTARRYGLVVNETVDQRLDVASETDAAMRYLGANRLRFGDWLLALAAYNQGEGHVQKVIDAAGTRDAWALIEAGHLNEYLVDVTASAILIRHPTLID